MDLVKKSLELFPEQCRQGWAEASKLSFSPKTIKNVLLCGMGGSRFPGLTLQFLFKDKFKVPFLINDDYTLPSFVNEESLVILSSYSGSTEETIASFKEALEKKAVISAITTGGEIKKLLDQNNLGGYFFNPIHNPSGQPRLGVGYMLMGLAGVLKALGVLEINDNEVSEAVNFAASLTSDQEKYQNLAQEFKDCQLFLIAAEHLRGLANGFANQVNENAKAISDFRVIPELNHHLMEGLAHPTNFKNQALFFFLTSSLYSPRIQKRFDLTKEVVEKQGIKTSYYQFQGKTKLAQVLEGFVLSGFTTYYLSSLYGVDPIKIPWVDYFKTKLGGV